MKKTAALGNTPGTAVPLAYVSYSNTNALAQAPQSGASSPSG